MQRHEWHETLEEGGQQFWRANYHGGRWKLLTKTERRGSWDLVSEPTTAHWEALREVLWNKYQRKRCPYKLVEKVDKILGRNDDKQDC